MKILAVDDQERILKALRVLVHWQDLGVGEVFTANSAESAKEILNKESIDILLTDIEMPGESGIALQKWQAEKHPEVTSIFLTSHADFSYAKEAIRNGAFDYILQPASIPEIEDTLRRCIAYRKEQSQLMEKSSQYDEKLSESLKAHLFALFHQEAQFSRMGDFRRDTATENSDWNFVPAVSEFTSDGDEDLESLTEQLLAELLPQDKGIRFLVCELDLRHEAFLFYSNHEMPDLRKTLLALLDLWKKHAGIDGRIHLGRSAKDDLPLKVRELKEFFTGKILKSGDVYVTDKTSQLMVRKPDGTVWSRWLIRGDVSLVRNQIANLIRFAEEEQYLTFDYLEQVLKAFFESCLLACYEQKREITDLFETPTAYEEIQKNCPSVEELLRIVDGCLERYKKMLPETEEEGNYSVQQRIQEILRYLDENMDLMVSRRDAAKYVFLNEDYFSRVFLKETGMRYKEYVLDRKMDYAKKLLTGTDLPVTLIASKVGYDNFTNFTKMFRKVCGMTPTDYRKNAKSEKG